MSRGQVRATTTTARTSATASRSGPSSRRPTTWRRSGSGASCRRSLRRPWPMSTCLCFRPRRGRRRASTDVPSFGLFETPNFTIPFNVCGLCRRCPLCNGFSAGGLPLSLQIVGRPFEEARGAQSRPCLRAGDPLEGAAPGIMMDRRDGRPSSLRLGLPLPGWLLLFARSSPKCQLSIGAICWSAVSVGPWPGPSRKPSAFSPDLT